MAAFCIGFEEQALPKPKYSRTLFYSDGKFYVINISFIMVLCNNFTQIQFYFSDSEDEAYAPYKLDDKKK